MSFKTWPFKTWRLNRIGMTSIWLDEDTEIVHWDDNRCGYRVVRRKGSLAYTHRDYNTYLEALMSVL